MAVVIGDKMVKVLLFEKTMSETHKMQRAREFLRGHGPITECIIVQKESGDSRFSGIPEDLPLKLSKTNVEKTEGALVSISGRCPTIVLAETGTNISSDDLVFTWSRHGLLFPTDLDMFKSVSRSDFLRDLQMLLPGPRVAFTDLIAVNGVLILLDTHESVRLKCGHETVFKTTFTIN